MSINYLDYMVAPLPEDHPHMKALEEARATGDKEKIALAEEAVVREERHKAEADMFMAQMADAYRD